MRKFTFPKIVIKAAIKNYSVLRTQKLFCWRTGKKSFTTEPHFLVVALVLVVVAEAVEVFEAVEVVEVVAFGVEVVDDVALAPKNG